MRYIQALYPVLLLALLVSPAIAKKQAEKRVALVIGNSGYRHTAHLDTPGNDAAQLARKLEKLGFHVLRRTDLDATHFAETMDSFSRSLRGADVALFYYAGHGLQFRGKNYIVPVDARLKNEFSLKRETFLVTDIIELMEAQARTNLVFLDACRNNPLAEKLRRSMSSTRSALLGRGLGRMSLVNGETLLVHAAASGTETLDSHGKYSPFASALLKHIGTPGLEVEVMLKRVTRSVQTATRELQQPERLSRLTSEFYFRKARLSTQTRAGDTAASSTFLAKRLAFLEAELKKQGENRFIPELVNIPGGMFMMGCVSGKDCQDDETPVHPVTLSPFQISKYETTFAQWDACVAAGGCKHKPGDRGWGRGNRPVIYVSWNDATAYASWLSKKTGQTWRLPTEAEWEYVARAGTTTRYAFGSTIRPDQANFGYRLKKTVPVGQCPANRFGVHDMQGNVWEWVSDRYSAKYYSSSPVKNPRGSATGASRGFRGGSWLFRARNLRSADRNNYAPNYRSNNLGFRLVRTR
jgi:formylglycine-generating enzyme required for sulfatase activity